MAFYLKPALLPRAQVAEKVGCPTDDRMVACLKSTDARTLTMAAPYIAQGSPDREHYFLSMEQNIKRSNFFI